jgi:DNA-binding MarR family transcriptional regulator
MSSPLSFVKAVCEALQIKNNAEFRVFVEFESNVTMTEKFARSLSYTELHIATGLSHQSLSNALKSLKNKELILSIKDQGDGRVVRYQLEQKARDLINDLSSQMILFAIESLQHRLASPPQSSSEIDLLAKTAFKMNAGLSTMNSDAVTTAPIHSNSPSP